MQKTIALAIWWVGSVWVLSACHSLPDTLGSDARPCAAPTHQAQSVETNCGDKNTLRSQHQADHGASAGHRAAFIEDYDVDGDNVVTRSEFESLRAANLNAMDSDANGLVNEDEYLDHFAQVLDKKISRERKTQLDQTLTRFNAIDGNADQKMMWREYWASGLKTFVHFAGSKAGVVTLSANNTAWDASPAAQQPVPQQHQAQETLAVEALRPAVLRMPSSHSLAGFIAINDADGDQQVSADEFKQVRREIFNDTDTNKNGWLDADEYVLEFTNRLDRMAKQQRTAQMKQAKVRYDILNANRDQGISVAEFAVSGARIFNGWDLNDDNQVSSVDPLPRINKLSNTALAPVANTALQ